MVSERERISHVLRRLGFGSQPELIDAVSTAGDATALALDLSATPRGAPVLEPPADLDAARDRDDTRTVLRYWLEQLTTSPRRIEERLVWFWHDHFATDLRKVKVPYLMYQQHLTVRQRATGSFRDLLQAVAVDPAMLIYLDGAQNAADPVDENFGREVMELFTLGRGSYSEDDVIAASRAFSGWIVLRPRTSCSIRRGPLGTSRRRCSPSWSAGLPSQRSPSGSPGPSAATIRSWTSLRRSCPSRCSWPTRQSPPGYERRWRRLSGSSKRSASMRRGDGALEDTLRTMSYIPFVPPNVAGFPKGTRLLDPHRLIHTFDFSAMLPEDVPQLSATAVMNRLGIFDISAQTADVLAAVSDPAARIALAINSPEYHLT